MTLARGRIETGLELAVIFGALATIPLTIAQEMSIDEPLLLAADWAIWAIFFVEFTAMLYLAAERPAYAKANWLSVAVIVFSLPLLPALLGLTRLVRLTRLARVIRIVTVAVRGSRAVGQIVGRRGFLYVSGGCAFLILAGAGVLVLAEPGTVSRSYWEAVWWGIVTTTTVGYGDIAPVSTLGRFVGVALMFAGIGLVATLAAAIAAHFVEQDDAEDQATVEAKLARIERLLERIIEKG